MSDTHDTFTPLDHFLISNATTIRTAEQKKIRAAYERMIAGKVEPFCPDQVPGHLYDEFLRLARQERYKAVNSGKTFDAKRSYLP